MNRRVFFFLTAGFTYLLALTMAAAAGNDPVQIPGAPHRSVITTNAQVALAVEEVLNVSAELSRVGVGFGYYFEKLDVVDFNTLDTNGPLGFSPATGDPRLDWLGGLTLGYGNRPYTGNTAYVRLLYRF